MLRSQIQLQSAEISKLQMENQKLQVMVPVTCSFIYGNCISKTCLPATVAAFLNQARFKCIHQQVIPARFQMK